MRDMYDVIIIGAGPAGLTAALYSGRFRMKTALLEKMSCGGQIVLSPNIENYPGFPSGINTSDLVERFKKQAEAAGVLIEEKEVVEVFSSNNGYQVKAKDGLYETKSVIVASGAKPKLLGVKGEGRFIGKGVSYCGTCDGPFFKNKDVVVVGGGDRAIEEALFLTSYARSVNLIHRRSEFRSSGILVEKLKANPKIILTLDSVIEEISGENKVNAVKVKNIKTNAINELKCDGVFIFVGIKPHTDFLKNFLEMNSEGFIITDQKMQTSKQGVFACGDCIAKTLYQVVTACAEGAVAADSTHKYLLTL